MPDRTDLGLVPLRDAWSRHAEHRGLRSSRRQRLRRAPDRCDSGAVVNLGPTASRFERSVQPLEWPRVWEPAERVVTVGSCAESEGGRSVQCRGRVSSIIVVLVIVGTDLWVYTDARPAPTAGSVVYSVGSIRLDRPRSGLSCARLVVFCFLSTSPAGTLPIKPTSRGSLRGQAERPSPSPERVARATTALGQRARENVWHAASVLSHLQEVDPARC